MSCGLSSNKKNEKEKDQHLNVPAPSPKENLGVCSDPEFKCKWLSPSNEVVDDIEEDEEETHLEMAATITTPEEHFVVGAEIVRLMLAKMPEELFAALAARAKVGFFTSQEKGTIFPEYEYMRDRPECEGICTGECSVTCTADGRKWDDLPGLGMEERGVCIDDVFMCTPYDPNNKTDNGIIHEFGHTVHQFGLPFVPGNWWDRINSAYENALENETWNPTSYAMVNNLEYFAKGAGVFFNVNHHPNITGGMSSCGRGPGQFCQCEEESRVWLQSQDPDLYEVLAYTFTGGDNSEPSGLHICMTEPNNGECL